MSFTQFYFQSSQLLNFILHLRYLLSIVVPIIVNFSNAEDINSQELPIGLTDFEKNNIDLILEMGRETNPPDQPVRNIAEFERMSGVLIRYPLGVSFDIVRELSEDVVVYCLVSSAQQNTAFSSFSNNSVNMENIEFIIGPTDSYWTRDYGPWWVVDGNREIGIVDFTYNRPRINDNNAPLKVSANLDVPYYSVDMVHCGGNYMTDGLSIGASSRLVYEENDFESEDIDSLMKAYYGINTYHVIQDPNDTYIDHIDCWGKYLSPTKVMIREVPTSHPQYNEIETVVNYFLDSPTSWGDNWDVHRVWTPNDQPYTNSIIVNDKILVPIMNSDWDDDALTAYELAMPGYEIIGFSGSWESTDALHCRVKGIPDINMLQLFHHPLSDTVASFQNEGYQLSIDLDALSGVGIIAGSVKVFWKNSLMSSYDSTQLYRTIIPETPDTYSGYIPAQAFSSGIKYFIQASDSSGRNEAHPIAGYHSFYALQTDVCSGWTLGDIDNSGALSIMDILILSELIIYDNSSGVCCDFVADVNGDGELSLIDIINLVGLVANQ